MRNKLVVAGSGIRAASHMTLETKGYIEIADKVLYLFADNISSDWLKKLNRNCEDLYGFYIPGKDRNYAYDNMVTRILECLEENNFLLVLFYGHPGVFVKPSFEAIAQARALGYEAWMLPGISAEDCIFADLLFDPAVDGCASYEATHFLVYRPIIDPKSYLILWQIGVAGDLTHTAKSGNRKGIQIIQELLTESYPSKHRVALYEATLFASVTSRIEWISLCELERAEMNAITTLIIPPVSKRTTQQSIIDAYGLGV